MNEHLTQFPDLVGGWALTSWLHSTLLLGLLAITLMLRSRFRQTEVAESHAFRERAWKFAAVAGLVTATLQVSLGTGIHFDLRQSASDVVQVDAPDELPRTGPAQTSAVDGLARLDELLSRLPDHTSATSPPEFDSTEKTGTLTVIPSMPSFQADAAPPSRPAADFPVESVVAAIDHPAQEAQESGPDKQVAASIEPDSNEQLPVSGPPALTLTDAVGWIAVTWMVGCILFLIVQSALFQQRMGARLRSSGPDHGQPPVPRRVIHHHSPCHSGERALQRSPAPVLAGRP